MTKFQWDQTEEGQQIDLRLTCKSDGNVMIHNLLQSGQSESFSSPSDATEYLDAMIQEATQS